MILGFILVLYALFLTFHKNQCKRESPVINGDRLQLSDIMDGLDNYNNGGTLGLQYYYSELSEMVGHRTDLTEPPKVGFSLQEEIPNPYTYPGEDSESGVKVPNYTQDGKQELSREYFEHITRIGKVQQTDSLELPSRLNTNTDGKCSGFTLWRLELLLICLTVVYNVFILAKILDIFPEWGW